jgi:excisionase family DNA binding protein
MKEINNIKFYEIKDLVHVCSISEPTIRKYIKKGKIKAKKIQGRWLISEEHLNEFLTGADNVNNKEDL